MYMKFGFPMAYTATMLAWGQILYGSGSACAGQLLHVHRTLRWFTDYMLKCHTGINEFYAQVGDITTESNYWGRPEDVTWARPAYRVTATNPGSDVVGESAAALAAAAIVFNSTDPAYAATLLTNAQQLYQFANQYRGRYSSVIPGARSCFVVCRRCRCFCVGLCVCVGHRKLSWTCACCVQWVAPTHQRTTMTSWLGRPCGSTSRPTTARICPTHKRCGVNGSRLQAHPGRLIGTTRRLVSRCCLQTTVGTAAPQRRCAHT
jgi:hypothetical protein